MQIADVIRILDEAPRQAASLDFIAGNANLSEPQKASISAGAEYIRKLCQLVRHRDI